MELEAHQGKLSMANGIFRHEPQQTRTGKIVAGELPVLRGRLRQQLRMVVQPLLQLFRLAVIHQLHGLPKIGVVNLNLFGCVIHGLFLHREAA